MNWQTIVSKDLEEMSWTAARELAQIAGAAVEGKGRFDLALSGGHTPRGLYEILASDFRQRIDWKRTHLFWSDERYVAWENPQSNYRMAREALIGPLDLPPENDHPMPTAFTDPEAAARSYEQTLREHFGAEGPQFDLLLLGVGPEGHTASLFPHSPALAETKRWVVAVRAPADPPLRLTLTLPAINTGKEVHFLVSGEDKREIVSKLLSLGEYGSPEFPASLVRPQGRVVLLLDRAAEP
jgi:6-phosphogluconolactonase